MTRIRLTFIALLLFFFCFQNAIRADSNTVIKWNMETLLAIKVTNTPPPIAARALAMVHTSMYDAWSAYDPVASSSMRGTAFKRPSYEWTAANKKKAISFAAYRTLLDLFPTRAASFTTLLNQLGYNENEVNIDTSTPAGLGNFCAYDLLSFRLQDGSNQLGNMPNSNGTPYSDYTGYTPVNSSTELLKPSRWQPLAVAGGGEQIFLVPQWGRVTPFALTSASEFPLPHPARYPNKEYTRQAKQIIELSAKLDDTTKAIAEYWSDGPGTVTPPGHWNLIAQFVSARDKHSLDDDVKMFFGLNNALFDSSIAAWYFKRRYNSVRPISAIHFLFKNEKIDAWAGPGLGTQSILGQNWQPYIGTPPFPEYVSGHSTFSSAAAKFLELFTQSEWFGASAVIPSGSSKIEPGITPSIPVTLYWKTYQEAANQAGLSRRLGGIHFKDGDLNGRSLGQRVGKRAFNKSLKLFKGEY